jgi:hypothetical protein
MKIGDKVKRKPYGTIDVRYWSPGGDGMMINHEYEIIHILDNGLLVLEDYLVLVHPNVVEVVK